MDRDDMRLLAFLTGERDLARTNGPDASRRERFNARVLNTPFADTPLPRLRGDTRDPTAEQAVARTHPRTQAG